MGGAAKVSREDVVTASGRRMRVLETTDSIFLN
jgi:hypothetical protein